MRILMSREQRAPASAADRADQEDRLGDQVERGKRRVPVEVSAPAVPSSSAPLSPLHSYPERSLERR
jgi:hypothetical protein